MPLEIRELVIKTTVNSDRPTYLSNVERDDRNLSTLSEANQSTIVAACVEQVLSILQAQSER